MNLLFTGATGVVGRTILPSLLALPGVLVTAVSRVDQKYSGAKRNINWVMADLRCKEDCDRIVRGQDVILHFASSSFPLTADAAIARDIMDNLVPTVNLLDALARSSSKTVPHVIFPSSGGAVYGSAASSRAWNEEDPCRPTTGYGIGKLAAEHYVRMFVERGCVTATILRIANIYGWVGPTNRPQGLINVAISHAMRGEPVTIVGSLENVRDYIHISDVWSAICAVLTKVDSFEIYNIGTGVGTSVGELLNLLQSVVPGGVSYIVEGEATAGHLPRWNVLDIAKASSALPWSPTITLVEGLRRAWHDAGSKSLPR